MIQVFQCSRPISAETHSARYRAPAVSPPIREDPGRSLEDTQEVAESSLLPKVMETAIRTLQEVTPTDRVHKPCVKRSIRNLVSPVRSALLTGSLTCSSVQGLPGANCAPRFPTENVRHRRTGLDLGPVAPMGVAPTCRTPVALAFRNSCLGGNDQEKISNCYIASHGCFAGSEPASKSRGESSVVCSSVSKGKTHAYGRSLGGLSEEDLHKMDAGTAGLLAADLSALDTEDYCSTCLELYSDENPKIWDRLRPPLPHAVHL